MLELFSLYIDDRILIFYCHRHEICGAVSHTDVSLACRYSTLVIERKVTLIIVQKLTDRWLGSIDAFVRYDRSFCMKGLVFTCGGTLAELLQLLRLCFTVGKHGLVHAFDYDHILSWVVFNSLSVGRFWNAEEGEVGGMPVVGDIWLPFF